MSTESHEDPYLILGVARNATDKEIKEAFRRQAKANHPDLHHDKPEIEQNAFKQQFQRAAAAFEILSDIDERAYYDKYGKSRNEAATTLSQIEKTILEILATCFNPMGQDVAHIDYVAAVKNQIAQKQTEAIQQLTALSQFQKQLKRVEGRFKKNGDPENAMAQFVKVQLANAAVQIEAMTQKAAHYAQCLEELKVYAYTRDEVPQQTFTAIQANYVRFS